MKKQEKPTYPVITDPQELLFGWAPRPVEYGHGLKIGGGAVYPEINFTLPPMAIEESTWKEVRGQYQSIIEEICQRAVTLSVPAVVVECELLPPMTLHPEWGGEIIAILRETLDRYHDKEGLKSALRATPVDIRDSERPSKMRHGQYLDKMLESFEICAREGADLLAIESIGGKQVHDEALVNGDLAGIVFGLGVLGVRDMRFLWTHIVDIASKYNVIPSGDTACGFANTAMVLAEKKMIPRILAAVDRVASVARTLVAHQSGAVGPTKDCAYEGPYLKALTGVPISMEGRTAACAHLSPLGNIASVCCDLWSNESVQNVRLLSTYAPVVSMEQLIYDCRLMNVALREGKKSIHCFQRLMVESDAHLDPQAYVLHPEIVMELVKVISVQKSPLKMTIKSVEETLKIMERGHQSGEIELNTGDLRWLDLLKMQLATLPETEAKLLDQMEIGSYQGKFIPEEYDLSV